MAQLETLGNGNALRIFILFHTMHTWGRGGRPGVV